MMLLSFGSRTHSIVDRVSFIVTLCKGKEVLNLGCADTTRILHSINSNQHLHVELSKVAARLVGIDVDLEALAQLKKFMSHNFELIHHDVEKLSELTSIGKFDVIVCGELIEHLSNPGNMLEGAKKLLKDRGIIVITTPNVLSLKFFIHHFFFGKDPSSDFHTIAFTPKTLSSLLKRHGFKEPSLYYSNWLLPSLRNYVFRRVFYGLLKFRPELADTIIAISKLERDGK